MLACKKLLILLLGGSNRATSPYMSKISCVAARKHDMSCGFANIWGGVLNVTNDSRKDKHDATENKRLYLYPGTP